MIPNYEKLDFKEFNDVLLQLFENGIDYCFCWSWKKYNECCKNGMPSRITQKKVNKINEYLYVEEKFWKDLFYKKEKLLWDKKCLYPWCKEKSIDSHIFPKNFIKKNCWRRIWWFEFDDYWKIMQVHKTPWENTAKLWCNNHDRDLFNLTDKVLYSDIKKEKIKIKYQNELLYKLLWFYKKTYEKELKYWYLFCYNYFLLWEMWRMVWIDHLYRYYNSACKNYYNQEKHFVNWNNNKNIEFHFLKWNETWKIFDLNSISNDKWELTYLIVFMPINGKSSAYIYKLNKNKKYRNEWYIRKCIKNWDTINLQLYLNNAISRKNKVIYLPTENRLIIPSAEDKMKLVIHNSVNDILKWNRRNYKISEIFD